MAVPPDRCEDPVRAYASFTSGVHALRDWLLDCGIKTAAMESTGNHWITLYDVLTQAALMPSLSASVIRKKLGELAARVECEVSSPLPEAPKGQRNVGKAEGTTAAA